jgi:tryptophan-rich sensory protein
MKIKNPRLLFVSILLPQLAGLVGSLATSPAIPSWYALLEKPSFNPPNWIFGPVWITLYTLMGISLYLIWVKGFSKKEINFPVKLFIFHLVLNSFWSVIFFGFKDLGLGLFVIISLWLVIAYLIKTFWKIDKRASYLLIPYLLWVSFASILNYFIWTLN